MTGRHFAYLGVGVGLVVSVAANVAHAASADKASVWSLGMSGFWPVALFIALEVLTRTTWQAGSRAVVVARVGVGVVAVVAAVISYWHLHGLLVAFKEEAHLAWLGPLAIDGLMAVSASALLTGQMTPVTDTPAQGVADTGSAKPATPVGDTRATIAARLADTPATVADLAELTGVSRTAVTNHLKKLEAKRATDGTYRLPVRRAS